MSVRLVLLSVCIALSGCGKHPTAESPQSPKQAPAVAERVLATTEPSEGTSYGRGVSDSGRRTEAYWNQCIQINEQFISSKQELWFKSMRPDAIGKTLREAARQLRLLDQSNVDAMVIDHVNAVMRGYEDMAGIIEKEGARAIWDDVATVGLFLLEIAVTRKQTAPVDAKGAVADAGNIPIGVGWLSESAFAFTSAAESDVKEKANELVASEIDVIRHVRETYGKNLKPW